MAPYLCRTCHKDGTITENRADLRGAVDLVETINFLTDLEDDIRQLKISV